MKATRNGPQVEEKEDDTWELYKKPDSSLKKAAPSLSATAEKVAAVKQSLASASEEVQQDPQHRTSLVALGSLKSGKRAIAADIGRVPSKPGQGQ